MSTSIKKPCSATTGSGVQGLAGEQRAAAAAARRRRRPLLRSHLSEAVHADEASALPPEAVWRRGAATRPRRVGWPDGEVVLDSAQAAGIDVLLSARRSGRPGRAYGLDMTDEMLALAEENKPEGGLTNVESSRARSSTPAARQLGGRESSQLRHQPVRGQGPGAARAFRVLRPGGRLP